MLDHYCWNGQLAGDVFNSFQRHIRIVVTAVHKEGLCAAPHPRPIHRLQHKIGVDPVELRKPEGIKKPGYQKHACDGSLSSFEEAEYECDAQAVPDKNGVE